MRASRQRGARYLLQGLVLCHLWLCLLRQTAQPRRPPRGAPRLRLLPLPGHRCLPVRRRTALQPIRRSDGPILLDVAVWREVSTLLAHPERLAEEYRRRLQPRVRTKPRRWPRSNTHLGKLRQGLARLIDSYADGLIDKQEFEPRIPACGSRIAQVKAQRQQLVDAATLQAELQLIIGRLEDFATKVHSAARRGRPGDANANLIRALVKRVEGGSG